MHVQESFMSHVSEKYSSVKFVKLFFILDGQLKVARVDPLLLVIVSSCTSKIKDLSKVFHRASWVDGCVYSNLCAVFSICGHDQWGG